MDNPFAKFRRPAVVETDKSENPFAKFKTPSREQVLSGQDPLTLGLEANREEDAQRELPPTSRQTQGVRTYDDLYGSVDARYEGLEEDSNQLAEHDDLVLSPERKNQKAIRDQEKMDIYNRTGRESSIFEGTRFEGSFFDPSFRVQTERKNNPFYDPTQDVSEDNPLYEEKNVLVPSPDDNVVKRVVLQIGENVIGGVGDAALMAGNKLGLTDKKGGLLTEGEVGKALPDQAASTGGEEFVTELTTFFIGPAAVTKGIKYSAKGLGKASGLVGKVANSISPESANAIKTTYDAVYRSTGSAQKAMAAAHLHTKRVVAGLAFGLTEAAVAPDGSEGLISREAVQETFNVSPERARDISFMLDTPIIGGTLNVLGGLWQTVADKMVKPAVGGLRNFNPLGGKGGNMINWAANKATINSRDAGLRVITWLDPNLTNASPEDFMFRVNVLSGAMDRSATKNVKLGEANINVAMDTPAAFNEIAKDYYSQAYEHLRDAFGEKEFNEWISTQAAETSNRLFELKTALISDPKVATQTAQQSSSLEELFNMQSGRASGELVENQIEAGQVLAGAQADTLGRADQMLEAGQQQVAASRVAADNAISNDPKVKELFEEYVNTNGSTAAIDRKLSETVTEPLFRSFKKLKTDTDAAYDKLYSAGADGNPEPILEIIGQEGANDPFLKNIAESALSDPSFKNIHNTLKNKINKQISALQGKPEMQEQLNTLKALRDNITGTGPGSQTEWLIQNGDGDVVDMAKEAKDKFLLLNSAFYDKSELERLSRGAGSERMAKEGFSVPEGMPGQGVGDWTTEAVTTVRQGLEGVNSETLRGYFERAASAGGEDVSKGIAEFYTAKSLSNIANRIASGSKESVATVRQGLKSYINILDSMNSPLLNDVKKLETNIQTLENAATLDEAAYTKLAEQVKGIQRAAERSVLNKFIHNGAPLEGQDVDSVMKSIFKSQKSGSDIKALLDRADTMGEEGMVVKEALQGTYLDYLKDRIFSSRQIAISDVKEGGKTIKGYKANEPFLRKFFEPGSKDMANLRMLFKDTPEIGEEIQNVASALQNLTRTTTKNEGLLKEGIDKASDPAHGLGSLITMTLGVLNPTATRARRILGPMAAQNLEQVKQVQSAIIISMLTDPKKFAKIAKDARNYVNERQAAEQLKELYMRAQARQITTNVDDEMEELQ